MSSHPRLPGSPTQARSPGGSSRLLQGCIGEWSECADRRERDDGETLLPAADAAGCL
nr:MAG TPA_asm: hypothetical protein [Caudoviricetes sp.]